MNRIGKIGKRNLEANKKLKWIYNDYGITICELGFKGCTMDNFLTFAHDHKRDWYKSKENIEKLADFNHTVLACQNCHSILEDDKELTEEIFKKLRPTRCLFHQRREV
jgi:hypothetical protein